MVFVELPAGEYYSVVVTVTNNSFRGGVPIGAELRVVMSAIVDGTNLWADTPAEWLDQTLWFPAEHSIGFHNTFFIGHDVVGKVGSIEAKVYDPNGVKIATGALPIKIVEPVGYVVNVLAQNMPSGAYRWYFYVYKHDDASQYKTYPLVLPGEPVIHVVPYDWFPLDVIGVVYTLALTPGGWAMVPMLMFSSVPNRPGYSPGLIIPSPGDYYLNFATMMMVSR